MRRINRNQRHAVLSAALAACAALGTRTTLGQTTDTPAPTPPPAPAEPMSGPASHPKPTSAGGAEEYTVPDRAGILDFGPFQIIDKPIADGKKWLSENARLDLGLRAAFFFQQATGGMGERTAGAQDYRIYGTFHAINFEEEKKGWAGNLYFRAEYRGEIGSLSPFYLNESIGTLFTTAYGQDEHSFAMVQLYWEQFLFDGALRLRAGKLDPDDYFNLGRWADDYRYFDNTLFSAFPEANHPSGGLGWNAQWYISKQFTLTGGMTDVQGKKTHSGFDTIGDGKFISAIDLTWSPEFGPRGLKGNYRVGYEHRDAVEEKGKPSDDSWYVNVDQEIAPNVAPFLRWGHGTGHSTGVEDRFSIGLGIDNAFDRPGDAFGIGFGFDTAADDLPGGRDIEYAGETFYRFQLTRAMQFSVGGQLIMHPVKAPGDDVVGVFWLRLVIDY